MNQAYLLTVLKSLENRLPPPRGAHHSIHYGMYGSDEQGWTDRLCLTLHIRVEEVRAPQREVTTTMFIDDGDLDKPVPQLVEEICAVLAGGRK